MVDTAGTFVQVRPTLTRLRRLVSPAIQAAAIASTAPPRDALTVKAPSIFIILLALQVAPTD